jgi:hypothetical protein
MAVYIVSYELRKPHKDYKTLYDYLGKFTHCHSHTSCWFIDTTKTTAEVRDGAKAHVDDNDIVFVGKLTKGTWNSYNLPCADWLQATDRRW